MLYKIDLEKAIEAQNNAISHLKKNSGLTEEQIKAGWQLCQMEDLVYETSSGEQHKRRQIFDGMAGLLGYDYKAAIEIEREKQILDVYEEISEAGGFIIEQEGVCENIFYAIWKDTFSVSAYKFGSVDRTIKDLGLDDVPEWIRKDERVEQLINSL